MLIDSRLKPELVAAKPPTANAAGDPVKHEAKEHLFIFRELPGVTPREVGEDEGPGVVFATNVGAAVICPCTLSRRYDGGDGDPAVEDVPGAMICAALAHARKNLVAPKTASLDLLPSEVTTPDGAAFPRVMPGIDVLSSEMCGIDPTRLLQDLPPTEPTAAITFDPFKLLAIAKAMGLHDGDAVTLLLRGGAGCMTVLPVGSDACNPGEAIGLLMPKVSRQETEE
jgi:hypothetical protein